MAEQSIKLDYRKWRGEKEYMMSVHRKYDFPITTRKVGDPAPATASDR